MKIMIRYGGMILDKNNDFTVYSANCRSTQGVNNYYICIPNNDKEGYSLYIEFPNKSINYEDKTSILEMMNNEREKINDDKAIYVLPVIPEELIIKEDNVNDDKVYLELVNTIEEICDDVFGNMIQENTLMDQSVHLITDSRYEEDFVDWINIIYVENKPQMKGIFQKERKNIDKNYDATTTNDEENHIEQEISKPKVRVLEKPKNNNGFSRIQALVITIILSLIVGISIAYYMVR